MTLNGKEIIKVEVPTKSWGFIVKDGKFWYQQNGTDKLAWHVFKPLPEGQWTLLGRPSEITEEVARGLVETINLTHQCLYRNYGKFQSADFRDIVDAAFNTATESLISWCKANGITEKHILLIKK